MLLSDKTDGNLVPRHPWWSLARSVSGVATGVMGFYAFSVLPMATCYAMFFAMPMLITLLSIPMLGERVGLHRGLAVVAGLGGVLVVLRPGTEALSWGHLAGIGAACMGALSSVIVRKIGKDERSIVLMMYPMLMSVAAMAVVLPFVYRPMPVEHLALTGVVAVMGMAGAFLMIMAYRQAPAVVVAPMQYSQIIWAAFYGWLLFDEGSTAGPPSDRPSSSCRAFTSCCAKARPTCRRTAPCWKIGRGWTPPRCRGSACGCVGSARKRDSAGNRTRPLAKAPRGG